MSETTELVVTTFDSRSEINVPTQFLSETGSTPSRHLLSFLRENEVSFPEEGMLTVTDRGYILHAVPKFG